MPSSDFYDPDLVGLHTTEGDASLTEDLARSLRQNLVMRVLECFESAFIAREPL